MKVRVNFVSNSSSTSFVLLVNKALFDKALENWQPSSEYLSTFKKDPSEIKLMFQKECKDNFAIVSLFNTEVYRYWDTLYDGGYDDRFIAALYEVLDTIPEDQKSVTIVAE